MRVCMCACVSACVCVCVCVQDVEQRRRGRDAVVGQLICCEGRGALRWHVQDTRAWRNVT